MSSNFINKKCIPCEGGIEPLNKEEAIKFLDEAGRWQIVPIELENKRIDTIQRRFKFDDFRQTMAFLREVEELAEAQGHHPDFCVHYNRVDFTIWTHAVGGLHENDFIIATGIDNIYDEFRQ